jgi:hypothetical protein
MTVFDRDNLDAQTLRYLLDAAANADIAHFMNNGSFSALLHEVQVHFGVDKPTVTAARRLEGRIRSWDVFDDALSNAEGNFRESSQMLRDIGTDEQSLGIWLESMILHDDLQTKLSESPLLPTQSCPSSLLHPSMASSAVSHDDFITFVRAYIGVACVFAVWGWADSLGSDHCREQTLAVVRLWQTVDGYSQVRFPNCCRQCRY